LGNLEIFLMGLFLLRTSRYLASDDFPGHALFHTAFDTAGSVFIENYLEESGAFS